MEKVSKANLVNKGNYEKEKGLVTVIPKEEVIDFFKNNRNSASFVGIMDYTAKDGEVSDRELIINVDYRRILKESLEKLNTIKEVETDEGIFGVGDELFDTARGELKISFEKSLVGENEHGNAINEAFVQIAKNIKIHKETNVFYIDGKLFNKKVKKSGEKKEVKSRLKTKIKDAIRNQLPVSEWRRFRLKDNYSKLAINKRIIEKNGLYYE